MKKASEPTTTTQTTAAPDASQTPQKLQVGRELLDTTWRITVPVLLFAVVGLLADRAFGTQPWLTLLGAMFGFLIAALLIKRQLLRGPQPIDRKPPPGSGSSYDRQTDDDEDEDYK